MAMGNHGCTAGCNPIYHSCYIHCIFEIICTETIIAIRMAVGTVSTWEYYRTIAGAIFAA